MGKTAYGVPSIMLIGVAKSGSYTLVIYAAMHPSIRSIAIRKATHCYFEHNSAERDNWYRQHLLGLYKHNYLYMGKCLHYINDPNAAQRIHDFNKSTKILATLREPVDRAISVFTHRTDLATRAKKTVCIFWRTYVWSRQWSKQWIIRYCSWGMLCQLVVQLVDSISARANSYNRCR